MIPFTNVVAWWIGVYLLFMKILQTIKGVPWYIWLSFLALAFLWGGTSRRLALAKPYNPIKFIGHENMDIWLRACGNLLILLIPVIILGALSSFFVEWVRFQSDFWGTLVNTIQIVLIYIYGVYASYRHFLWREKNLPLLKKNEPET